MSSRLHSALRHEVVSSSMKVLIGSGAAVAANGVSGVLSARALSVSDKGILAMALTIGGLLFVGTSLATNVALRVEYPKAVSTVTMRSFFLVSAKLIGIHGIATFAMIEGAHRWIPGFDVRPLAVFLVFLLSVLFFASSQAIEALHALGHNAAATASDAVGAAATAVMLLLLFVTPSEHRTLVVIIGCYTGGYGVRLALAWRRVVVLDHRRGSQSDIDGGQARLVTVGLKFLGYHVGQGFAFRADRYLLGIVSSPGALGIYSVAATPAELMRLPVTALSQVMMQRTAALGVSPRALVRSCAITALVTVPIACVLLAFADPLISFLFGPRYAPAAPVLRVMVLSELIVAFYIVLVRISAGAGLAKSTTLASGLGALSGLFALFLLAPQHGALGAAWASVIGYLVMAFGCLPALVRHAAR